MHSVTLEAEAGRVSVELALRGIDAATRVRVTVDVIETEEGMALSVLNQAGSAFAWLESEPDLYSDTDLGKPAG